MSSLHLKQLKALFVKDWLIRRRHWFLTLLELFLPLLLTWILLTSLKSTRLNENSTQEIKVVPQVASTVSPTEAQFRCYLVGDKALFTPERSDIIEFMNNLSSTCEIQVRSYPDENTIIDLLKTGEFFNTLIGVSFHSFDADLRRANYSIISPSLGYDEPWSESYQPISDFFSLQAAINLMMAPVTSIEFNYTKELLPENISTIQPPQSQSELAKLSKIEFFITFTFMEFGFLFTVAIMIRHIVKEKSTNSKEFLLIMGMSNNVYWISHFINYFTISIFHGITITSAFYFSDVHPFGNWTPSAFFIFYLMTSISVILSTFVLSTVINRPVIAVLVAIVLRSLLGHISVSMNSSVSSFLLVSVRTWSCLLPDGGLYYSLQDLVILGNSNRSAWNNLLTPIKDSIPLGYVFILTLISWFIYGFLTWYLDAVFPWQPGIHKPWYFIFNKFLNNNTDETKIIDIEARNQSGLHESMSFRSEANIRCINLHRSFGSLGFRSMVVNGINLEIMKGQITVLLGHNGAGKTTTMNMITGILPPSSGTVLINGIDIRKHVIAARRALALCPQTSLFFEELTVTENLNLCAGLRGLEEPVKRQLIPLNISRVNLQEKTNTLACKLSGGMKRRLQLALALTTSSEILILDEPTSGLDPESRRQIWNLLLEMRKNLTILLTTHFMEEADALGDRIIIMDSGQIKCSGSPMFLKNKLGAGYLLRIAKNSETFNFENTNTLIKSFFPNCAIINDTNEEIVIRLANEDSRQIPASNLPDLCDHLDEDKESLGIITYGIDVSTLEDVFLRVSMANNDLSPINISTDDSMFNVDQIFAYNALSGCALTLQRLKGLVYKRYHHVKRHKKTLIFTFLLPILGFYFTFYSVLGAVKVFDLVHQEKSELIEINARSIYGNVQSVILTDSTENLSPLLRNYVEINREMGIETKIINSSWSSFSDYLTKNNEDRATFLRKYVFGLIEIRGNIKLWHNPKAVLGLQLSIDAYSNALVRLRTGQIYSRMTTIYKSVPPKNFADKLLKRTIVVGLVSIFAPFGICFIASSYFLFPSDEYNSKAALIQRMSGIETLLFWTSHYFFDIIYHSIVSILIFSLICYVDPFFFWNHKFFVATLSLLLLFGFSSIPLTYLLTYLPITSDGGFVFIVVISLIASLVGGVTFFLFNFFFAVTYSEVMLGFLFPPFTMTTALAILYSKVVLFRHCTENNEKCDTLPLLGITSCCSDKEIEIYSNPFDVETGVYYHTIMLSIAPFIYFFLLIILDMNLNRLGYWYETLLNFILGKTTHPVTREDDDIAIERDRVHDLLKKPSYPDSLIVYNLTKDFRSFRAVDNLNFTVRQKECFGLLGVNGAGKTTTFRMLTGDLLVTSGDAFIRKISLRNDINKFQKSISYCPQFDALLNNLNPRETLALFARLRGMPEYKVRENVDYMIKSLDLSKFECTLNHNLSGGNKRKLSLAIASIGKPDLMFLDEPTTGVDPVARRKIWSSLVYLRDFSGSSIILTSHSMDECEALCNRIGIMARGKLRCLGSAQYLKEKFGQGFSLLIKMNHEAIKDPGKVEQINSYISDNFPSCDLRDNHQTILHYHITDTSSRWGDMLRKMEAAKSQLPIEDYTLTGTTLEQVFLSFAKNT